MAYKHGLHQSIGKYPQNWGNVQTPGCAEEQGVMLAQFYLMVNARSKKSKEKR